MKRATDSDLSSGHPLWVKKSLPIQPDVAKVETEQLELKKCWGVPRHRPYIGYVPTFLLFGLLKITDQGAERSAGIEIGKTAAAGKQGDTSVSNFDPPLAGKR